MLLHCFDTGGESNRNRGVDFSSSLAISVVFPLFFFFLVQASTEMLCCLPEEAPALGGTSLHHHRSSKETSVVNM